MFALRYITRGFIDGSLSTLGIVLGAAIGGDPKIVIAAGLGGGIANSISNLLGAVTAEKAGIMLDMLKYEDSMVGSKINLKDTKIYDQEKRKIWAAGISDGVATFFGAVIPVLPFIPTFFSNMDSAAMISIGITISLLFGLGVYLGKISKENLAWAGAKMAIFGGVTAILAMSLKFLFN